MVQDQHFFYLLFLQFGFDLVLFRDASGSRDYYSSSYTPRTYDTSSTTRRSSATRDEPSTNTYLSSRRGSNDYGYDFICIKIFLVCHSLCTQISIVLV